MCSDLPVVESRAEPNAENKDCAPSKSSPAAHNPSSWITQTTYTSDNTAKRLRHSVRGTEANTSLLKSSSNTAAHYPLTGDKQKELLSGACNPTSTNDVHTFCENATLQKRNFTLHYIYSAAPKNSAKNTKTKINTSLKNTGSVGSPNKLSSETPITSRDLGLRCTSAHSEQRLEINHNTNHHDNLSPDTPQNQPSLPTPKHTRDYSNQATALKPLLSPNPSHTSLFSKNASAKEDSSVQHEQMISSYSATHTQSGPNNPSDHPGALSLGGPAQSFVLKSLSLPLTHRRTVSPTTGAPDMPKQFSAPQNSRVTSTPSTPAQQVEERTPQAGPRGCAGVKTMRSSVHRLQEYLDPVSSFMMLRGVLRLPLEQRPDSAPLCNTGNQTGCFFRLSPV